MVNFHVIDIMINALHVKRQLYLPVYIKRITGVLFFPVIPIPSGAPDGNPLGVAALSLENEKVNVVTNMSVFRKAPCFYQGKDIADAGGETFLDSGYNGHRDFFACNDEVSPNSYVLFKYSNRRNINVPLSDDEQWAIDWKRLEDLEDSEEVLFRGCKGRMKIESITNIWIYLNFYLNENTDRAVITKSDLKDKIYEFQIKEGDEYRPAYIREEIDYDTPYNLKIVLRHEIE